MSAPVLNAAGNAAHVHRLKCWAENFDAILDGRKRCEVRTEEDRQFKAGDVLELIRTDRAGVPIEPRVIIRVEITHVERHAGALELRGSRVEDAGGVGGALTPIAVLSLMTNRIEKHTFPPAGAAGSAP